MKLMKWKPMTFWTKPENDYFGSLDRFFDNDFGSLLGQNFQPAIDVFEEDGHIRVKADMPGMNEKDLSVEMKDGLLTISGEKKDEKEEKKDNYYYSERRFGSFTRSFRLPDGVEADKIEANFKNGVLDIDVPLSEQKKPKKISIKS